MNLETCLQRRLSSFHCAKTVSSWAVCVSNIWTQNETKPTVQGFRVEGMKVKWRVQTDFPGWFQVSVYRSPSRAQIHSKKIIKVLCYFLSLLGTITLQEPVQNFEKHLKTFIPWMQLSWTSVSVNMPPVQPVQLFIGDICSSLLSVILIITTGGTRVLHFFNST